MVRPLMPAPPRPIFVWGAKIMGATMWCWIFWRLKHDWRDVFVSLIKALQLNLGYMQSKLLSPPHVLCVRICVVSCPDPFITRRKRVWWHLYSISFHAARSGHGQLDCRTVYIVATWFWKKIAIITWRSWERADCHCSASSYRPVAWVYSKLRRGEKLSCVYANSAIVWAS